MTTSISSHVKENIDTSSLQAVMMVIIMISNYYDSSRQDSAICPKFSVVHCKSANLIGSTFNFQLY